MHVTRRARGAVLPPAAASLSVREALYLERWLDGPCSVPGFRAGRAVSQPFNMYQNYSEPPAPDLTHNKRSFTHPERRHSKTDNRSSLYWETIQHTEFGLSRRRQLP